MHLSLICRKSGTMKCLTALLDRRCEIFSTCEECLFSWIPMLTNENRRRWLNILISKLLITFLGIRSPRIEFQIFVRAPRNNNTVVY